MTSPITPDPHYTHPRLARIYDLDSPWSHDTDFYISMAGPEPCSVLDLGCGTGTLCCALANRGHVVTGVDPATAMLDVARRKPDGHLVDWVESAAQDFLSDKQFDRVFMTGHAFQVLLSDADVHAVLTTAFNHLKPDGLFVFESRNPEIDWEKKWRREFTWPLPDGDVYQMRSPITRAGELVSFTHTYRFPDETLESPSTLRFMPQHKIEVMLLNAGLKIQDCLGDWSGTPFDPGSSPEMIFLAIR